MDALRRISLCVDGMDHKLEQLGQASFWDTHHKLPKGMALLEGHRLNMVYHDSVVEHFEAAPASSHDLWLRAMEVDVYRSLVPQAVHKVDDL